MTSALDLGLMDVCANWVLLHRKDWAVAAVPDSPLWNLCIAPGFLIEPGLELRHWFRRSPLTDYPSCSMTCSAPGLTCAQTRRAPW